MNKKQVNLVNYRFISMCKHGNEKGRCETCAAWDSAQYNAKRAERAEAMILRLKRKNAKLQKEVDGWRGAPFPDNDPHD